MYIFPSEGNQSMRSSLRLVVVISDGKQSLWSKSASNLRPPQALLCWPWLPFVPSWTNSVADVGCSNGKGRALTDVLESSWSLTSAPGYAARCNGLEWGLSSWETAFARLIACFTTAPPQPQGRSAEMELPCARIFCSPQGRGPLSNAAHGQQCLRA